MTEEQLAEKSSPTPQPSQPKSLIIRPWPKVVFLYPTFIAALICWIISLFSGNPELTPEQIAAGETAALGTPIIGNIFMIVFVLNLLVFSFDFSRIKSITILIGLIAVVLGVGWANTQWGWFEGIKDVLSGFDIRMNTQFYGTVSVFLAFVLMLVFVNTRFNYYEINHRELLHHHGYLGDITRMPTAGLHVHKEIYDLMEYVLLRSGRLIFYPQTKREAIVIDNVMNVNKVEDHIKNLLSVMAVRMSPDMQAIEH